MHWSSQEPAGAVSSMVVGLPLGDIIVDPSGAAPAQPCKRKRPFGIVRTVSDAPSKDEALQRSIRADKSLTWSTGRKVAKESVSESSGTSDSDWVGQDVFDAVSGSSQSGGKKEGGVGASSSEAISGVEGGLSGDCGGTWWERVPYTSSSDDRLLIDVLGCGCGLAGVP